MPTRRSRPGAGLERENAPVAPFELVRQRRDVLQELHKPACLPRQALDFGEQLRPDAGAPVLFRQRDEKAGKPFDVSEKNGSGELVPLSGRAVRSVPVPPEREKRPLQCRLLYLPESSALTCASRSRRTSFDSSPALIATFSPRNSLTSSRAATVRRSGEGSSPARTPRMFQTPLPPGWNTSVSDGRSCRTGVT